MPGIREDLLVSLSTNQFDVFELTPRICLINMQWSLSTVFFSCCSLRKSLGTNFLVKWVPFQTSQLYVQIVRIILSKSLSNTLRFPDANLLVLPSRVYITLLALLQSSWMFTLIPIVCYNSSQVWIYFTNFKWFLCETERMYLSWGLSFFSQPWLLSFYCWQWVSTSGSMLVDYSNDFVGLFLFQILE